MNLQSFKNLLDLLTYFKDEQVCRDYLELVRWNGNLECPYTDCGHNKVFKYSNGKVYKCAACKRQYSVKVGTIFDNSKLPLQKWFAAIYLITAHKKGISSLQLHRDIGVTQKTAWYMNHRVRHSLGLAPEEKLTGIVEADEHFVGGLEGNKHASKRIENTQGRSVKTKTPVAGAVQRGGKVKAKVITNTGGENLKPFILQNVEKKSILYTDEWFGYNGLERLYQRGVIKHNDKQYVSGNVHTNTMEGFWSLLARGVLGIYHSISAKHLQKYLDEFTFRYNTRDLSECNRFNAMLKNSTTTLPYKQLVHGKETNWVSHTNGISAGVELKQGSFSF